MLYTWLPPFNANDRPQFSQGSKISPITVGFNGIQVRILNRLIRGPDASGGSYFPVRIANTSVSFAMPKTQFTLSSF